MPLSAVEGVAKNVSRRVPLAINPLCRQANNASAPQCGIEADDSISLARSGERSEKSLPYKHFVQGRYRTTAPAVERVCCKAVAVCSIGVGADTVGAQRVRCRGDVEASHCDTLLFRCADRAAFRCSKCIGKRLPWRAQRRTWRDCIVAFGWEGLR